MPVSARGTARESRGNGVGQGLAGSVRLGRDEKRRAIQVLCAAEVGWGAAINPINPGRSRADWLAATEPGRDAGAGPAPCDAVTMMIPAPGRCSVRPTKHEPWLQIRLRVYDTSLCLCVPLLAGSRGNIDSIRRHTPLKLRETTRYLSYRVSLCNPGARCLTYQARPRQRGTDETHRICLAFFFRAYPA